MKIYHYNDEGIFRQEGQARRSPLDKDEVYLIPKNATTLPPPEVSQGHVPVFQSGQWTIWIDKRGTLYWDPDSGESRKVLKVGADVPPQSVPVAPPQGMISPKWNGSVWQETYVAPPVKGIAIGFKDKAKLKSDLANAKNIDEIKTILDKVLFTGENA